MDMQDIYVLHSRSLRHPSESASWSYVFSSSSSRSIIHCSDYPGPWRENFFFLLKAHTLQYGGETEQGREQTIKQNQDKNKQ